MLVTNESEYLWVLVQVKSRCMNKIEVKASKSIMMTIQHAESFNQTASYLYASRFSMKKGYTYLLPKARLPRLLKIHEEQQRQSLVKEVTITNKHGRNCKSTNKAMDLVHKYPYMKRDLHDFE